jgi:hypothetical protein
MSAVSDTDDAVARRRSRPPDSGAAHAAAGTATIQSTANFAASLAHEARVGGRSHLIEIGHRTHAEEAPEACAARNDDRHEGAEGRHLLLIDAVSRNSDIKASVSREDPQLPERRVRVRKVAPPTSSPQDRSTRHESTEGIRLAADLYKKRKQAWRNAIIADQKERAGKGVVATVQSQPGMQPDRAQAQGRQRHAAPDQRAAPPQPGMDSHGIPQEGARRTHAEEASDACAARNDEEFRRLCRRHQVWLAAKLVVLWAAVLHVSVRTVPKSYCLSVLLAGAATSLALALLQSKYIVEEWDRSDTRPESAGCTEPDSPRQAGTEGRHLLLIDAVSKNSDVKASVSREGPQLPERRVRVRKVAPPTSSPQDHTRPKVHATSAPLQPGIDSQQGIPREGDPGAADEACDVRMEDHGRLQRLCRPKSRQGLARPKVHALPAPLQPETDTQQGIPRPALRQHASFPNLPAGPLSPIEE